MNYIIMILLLLIPYMTNAQEKGTYLKKNAGAKQLMVNGEPFLILGGFLGNSTAACFEDIESYFPKLKRIGVNTVLVPACWDLTEPEEGKFDFSLTDKIIDEAKENELKVIFLWFGAWKNSMSCYTPSWFKKDYKKYSRSYTKEGKPLEIASVFSENVFNADNKAFGKWLEHIAQKDKNNETVIMIQIENEIGMLEDARDHSVVADSHFKSSVPQKLMNHLIKNRKNLNPYIKEKWDKNGSLKSGTWSQIFGNDIYTDEIFMAWFYAEYVNRMAKTAREIYDVPLFVNAAMNSRNRKPGEYPSAGPLAHLSDIWKCGAPEIDFISPDIYDKGFQEIISGYHFPENPLFIPEIRRGANNGVQAFYAFGEHDAIGFSPFAIEDGEDSQNNPFVQAYSCLNEMMPLITKYQGKGVTKGFLFDSENKERIIKDSNIIITGRHFFTLPWDQRATDGSVWPEGGGMIIRTGDNEYIIAGSGIVLTFASEGEINFSKNLGEDGFINTGGGTKDEKRWTGKKRTGILSVDEVNITSQGELKYKRRLNGDQDHQGRHVRIGVDDFKILNVKLYEYN